MRVAYAVTTQLTTEGVKMYGEAVEGVFGMDWSTPFSINLYGNDSSDLRYSTVYCIGTPRQCYRIAPIPRTSADRYRASEPHDATSGSLFTRLERVEEKG